MLETDVLNALIAFAPPLILLFGLHLLSRRRGVKTRILLVAFSLGFLAAPIALGVFYLLDFTSLSKIQGEDVLSLLLYSFCIVALVEESAKFVLLRYWIFPLDVWQNKFQATILACALGLGFAAIENVFYIIDQPNVEGSLKLAASRFLTAVPAHAAFGIVMGYYLGKAKFFKKFRREHLVYAWIMAILLHGLYNFSLYLNNRWIFALVAGLILFYAFRLFLLAGRERLEFIAEDEQD